MLYYYLEPEVAGDFGENSEVDTSVHPPKVYKLHYEFEGWLGDELLETFPCYIVSEKMRSKIESISPIGCFFDSVETTKSQQFDEICPEVALPSFFWLKVIGKAGVDDFGVSNNYRLVVSERVLHIIQTCNIENCGIEVYP